MSDREWVVILGHGRFDAKDGGSVPVPADMPGVAGVFVGGCVARGFGHIDMKRPAARAHAHIYSTDRYKGWVCFQLPEYLANHRIRMHELAHIISGQWHTAKWRAVMASLGYPVPPKRQTRRS